MHIKTVFCTFLLLMSLLFFSSKHANLLAQVAQETYLDTLLTELSLAKQDTNKANLFYYVANAYFNTNPELSIQYGQQGVALSRQLDWHIGTARNLWIIGRAHWKNGKYEEARRLHQEALHIHQAMNDKSNIALLQQSIGQDYADDGKYTEALQQFDLAIETYNAINDLEGVAGTYLLKAWVYGNLGNTVEAVTYDYKALQIFEEIGDTYGIVVASSNISEGLIEEGKYEEAIDLQLKGINYLKDTGDQENESNTYLDISNLYLLQGKHKEALEYTIKAIIIAEKIADQDLIAKGHSNIGAIYEDQQKLEAALDEYKIATVISRNTGDKNNLADLCIRIANIYVQFNQYEFADQYLKEAYQLSSALGSLQLLRDYHITTFNRYKQIGDWKVALTNYQQYIAYKDSLYNEDVTQKLVQAKMQYEFDKKELANQAAQATKDKIAAEALSRQKWIRDMVVAGLLLLLIFTLILMQQRNNIAQEKRRSDNLLLNILPAETAEELKRTGATKAQSFDEVTVMFTDFKNFTALSEQMSAQDLVNEINYCYSAFDNIITKHGIEKIKTIGDSYMCAGGLPVANTSHAENVVRAALEIRDFMLEEQKRRQAAGKVFFEVRIGCNTGPVVAGIVGIKKFAYDIWGDTVNMAARMESSSEVSKINISGSTYALVKDLFSCSYRGKIEAKNKGVIDMYFVEPL